MSLKGSYLGAEYFTKLSGGAKVVPSNGGVIIFWG